MLMTTFLFADMFHMVIFTENREQCSQVDFYNEHDLFSDYCADVLFRSSLRSFAILAGDVGLDDYWEFGSIKVVILWVCYVFIAVVILLNVLIAIVTQWYEKSNEDSHRLLGMARIPILAKHSFLDTEARKISERGSRDFRYRLCLALAATFVAIFCLSYIALVRAINVGKDDSVSSVSHVMDYVKIILLSYFYIIANVAVLVTVKDLLHIDVDLDCYGAHYIQLILKPLFIFTYKLLGVESKSDNGYETGKDLDQADDMYAIKEMIDASMNRVRLDLTSSITKMNELPAAARNEYAPK